MRDGGKRTDAEATLSLLTALDGVVLCECMSMVELEVVAYLEDVPHGGETIVIRTEVDGSAPKQLVLQESSSLRRGINFDSDEPYADVMTCRIEVFVRSGHTIDLALEDGEDSAFTTALHEAWASPERIEGFTHLALGAHAVVLVNEIVGYRLHGAVRPDTRRL